MHKVSFVSLEMPQMHSSAKLPLNYLTLFCSWPQRSPGGSDPNIKRKRRHLTYLVLLIIGSDNFLGLHFKPLCLHIDFYKADGDKELPSPDFTLDLLVPWLP